MSEYGSVRKETEANLQRFKQNKLSLKDQIEKDVQAVKDGIEKVWKSAIDREPSKIPVAYQYLRWLWHLLDHREAEGACLT